MKISARSLVAFGAVGLALANVGRIPAGALGGRPTPFVVDDLVTVLIWAVLAALILSRKIRLTLDDVSVPAALFVLVAAVSTALGVQRYGMGFHGALGAAAFLARWVLYFGWYLFVVWCLTPDEARGAWRYVEWAILAVAAFGILQSAFLPGFAQMVQSGTQLQVWDVQGRRLVSTLLDPNFAGLLIAIGLLFRFARIAEGIRERNSGWILTLLTVGLLLTVSRSSALALLVGLLVIVSIRGIRFRTAYIFLVGAALLVPAFWLMSAYAARLNKLRVDTSAVERLIPWSRAIRLVFEHPALGVGFNTIAQAQAANHWIVLGTAQAALDGGLLFVAAMTGLLGLGAYLWMLGNVAWLSRRAYRDSDLRPADRAHGVATLASTLAVVVHSLFANSLLLPFVMQILWIMWATLTHIVFNRRIRVGAAAVVPLLILVSGCEPCAGTSVCRTTAKIDLIGQIVDGRTGAPAPDVQVAVTLPGGEQASATTRGDGGWEISRDVQMPDSLSATVTATVTAPGHAGYTTPPIPVHVSTRAGDATMVGTWFATPYVHYLATLLYHGTPLKSASVRFAPTGGVSVSGTLTGATNSVGTFAVTLGGDQLGSAIGTLTVTQASLSRPIVLTGYQIPLGFQYGIPAPQASYNLGAKLTYGAQVIFRGTEQYVQGVKVNWTRTGGIATTPATFNTTTDANGFFTLNLTPNAEGTTIGTFTLTPPNAPAITYRNFELATYDSTSARSLGAFRYGQGWAWAIELWRNDSLKQAKGVHATFRRTGGLAITPDSLQLVTASDGRIVVRASVTDTGVVDGEITVQPDSGPSRLITGLHLGTYASDTLRFAGVFGFGPSLRYVGEIRRWDGAAVVGASVTWAPDSGLATTPSTLTSTTDGNGRFDLTLYPPGNADGTVVGHLIVKPVAPYAPGSSYTVTGVRLTTFDTSELRFAGVFAIPNP